MEYLIVNIGLFLSSNMWSPLNLVTVENNEKNLNCKSKVLNVLILVYYWRLNDQMLEI
jgi:hypothetical protein